jgi:hypothetical protein
MPFKGIECHMCSVLVHWSSDWADDQVILALQRKKCQPVSFDFA